MIMVLFGVAQDGSVDGEAIVGGVCLLSVSVSSLVDRELIPAGRSEVLV